MMMKTHVALVFVAIVPFAITTIGCGTGRLPGQYFRSGSYTDAPTLWS